MSPEQLSVEAVRRRHARESRLKRRAVDMAPRADPRDACGLKWQFSCGGSPLLIRLLRWAMRGARH